MSAREGRSQGPPCFACVCVCVYVGVSPCSATRADSTNLQTFYKMSDGQAGDIVMENRCNPVLHPQVPRGPPAPLDQGGAGGTTWVNLSGLEGVSVPTAQATTTQLEGRSASQHPSREGVGRSRWVCTVHNAPMYWVWRSQWVYKTSQWGSGGGCRLSSRPTLRLRRSHQPYRQPPTRFYKHLILLNSLRLHLFIQTMNLLPGEGEASASKVLTQKKSTKDKTGGKVIM